MRFIAVILFCSVILGCTEQKASTDQGSSGPVISEEKTREILDHHFKAFQENDLEETMKDYTEESILILPDTTYRGMAAIRTNFENAFKLFPRDSTTMVLTQSTVAHDIGYIIWTAKTPQMEVSFGTDSFIIHNGKIVRQTFAGVFN